MDKGDELTAKYRSKLVAREIKKAKKPFMVTPGGSPRGQSDRSCQLERDGLETGTAGPVPIFSQVEQGQEAVICG